MEIIEDSLPSCTLKCLRNVNDASNSVHALKYGVNTIGRGLNNDIIIKNLNVSRTHCHLRVEKQDTKDIAFIKDLGTSNGTIIGNINLIEFEEHQLNDLDMIVLASGDEGVILQFIDQIDRTISCSKLSNNQMNNKRKVLYEETLDDATTVKIPKLTFNEQTAVKEPFSNETKNLSSKSNNLPINSNLQHTNLNQLTSSVVGSKSIKNSDFQMLLPEKSTIVTSNNTKPSCSHNKNSLITSIKIEPNIINNIYSQGTYRKEEDSVIVIYSSDEENNISENDIKLPNIKIEQEHFNLNKSSMINSYPSTSKVENIHFPEWSNLCQRNELVSENEDEVIYMSPSKLDSNNIIALKTSSDSDSDSIKCPKIIEPFPMIPNKRRGQTKKLTDNENIMKTRTKTEKRINNKKKAGEIIVNQNIQIVQERRIRLQQFTKNNNTSLLPEKNVLNENPSTNESHTNEPSTTNKLKKKTRISRLQQNDNNNLPSMSKSHLTTEVEKNDRFDTEIKVKFNFQNVKSKSDNQISFLNCNQISSSSRTRFMNPLNFVYFDTLSKICKWNALWLHEEKFVDESPPLVKTIGKMKRKFENSSEYSSIVESLLLHEIWSKISDSYNMILNKNPSLEKFIFEKSLKKNVSLLTFDIQSVNKDFSTSMQTLKPFSEKLWCLKCIETNKRNISTGPPFSLKGYLCIVIIQSKQFETDTISVKKPTKSRNIFFAYVNTARKIGSHSNTQLYIELIVTKKSENIPIGTLIHLMDICYLHSELRLFQALNNATICSLSNALITTQTHNYTVDYSKTNLKHYNINSLMLNKSQKEAVKMAITICLTKEPNVGLIIGPPGTGKTNVISYIVLSLMSKLQTNTCTKPKLLICAPSNEAVDALARRIVEIKKDIKHELQFNVVRMGSGHKYDPNSPIVDIMLNTLVKQRMMNNSLNEAYQKGQSNTLSIFINKNDVEKNILQNADVIVTTLNSCFSNRMEDAFITSTIKTLNNCRFTACIVDEAGQCIEPLNYVPLLLGIDKLILVGDDKQLQPVVKSKLAKDNGLGISLFKRLKTWFEHEHYTRKNFPITMLDTQYRMHHEICLFPSKYFYKGLIKTAPSVKIRKQLLFQPYIILEHDNQQESSGEVNIAEANMIVSLVELLLDSECNVLTIAVLTPYHKQREQINVLLGNKKISLNVNTIDSFQGGECDILLISTVRTNGVGFMDDICRLNVALTRAKQSLIICGNFKSLKGEQVWCDLLEDAKKRKLIKQVSNKVVTNSRALLSMIKY